MPRLSEDKILPPAITKIKLAWSLQNCGVPVKDAFDKSTAAHLYVYDDMQLGYSDWADQEPEFSSKCFHVDNPGSICIALLPLDGRIITAKEIIEGGVCDCLLLTEKEMCFIEFKTNATSTETLRIRDNAAKASEQLWHTYNVII